MTAYGVLRAVFGPLIRAAWSARAEGVALPSGALLVVSNHDSLADPFFLGAAVDRPLRFLAKQELWANRIAGRILDGLGGIPVRRGRGDLDALAAASDALRAGAVVAIFPVRIVGADRALRPGTRIPRRARVRVVVGEPIRVEPAPATIAAAKELTARMRATIESLA